VVTRDRIIPAADVTSEAGNDHRPTVMLDRTRADVEAVPSLLFGPSPNTVHLRRPKHDI
jgi:hypothetical protein